MRHTYAAAFSARTVTGITVIIPDQVADNQREYDGKTFPVLRSGKKVRATLRGDLYGLWTPGTGDCVVSLSGKKGGAR